MESLNFPLRVLPRVALAATLAVSGCGDERPAISLDENLIAEVSEERCKMGADGGGSLLNRDDDLRTLLEGNRIVEYTRRGSPFSGEYFLCDGTWNGFVVDADIWDFDGQWTTRTGGQLCVELDEPSPAIGAQAFCRSVLYGPNKDQVFISDFLLIRHPRAEMGEPRWLKLEPLAPKAR